MLRCRPASASPGAGRFRPVLRSPDIVLTCLWNSGLVPWCRCCEELENRRGHRVKRKSSAYSAAVVLSLVNRRFWSLFQGLAVPDGAFTRVIRQFEILGQFKAVGGASVLAQSAEHAAAEVVGESGELLATRIWIAFAAHHDQVLGASQGAEVTRDAERLVCLRIDVQPRCAAIALRHLRSLKGILLGINLPRVLVAESQRQAFDEVQQQDLPQRVFQAGVNHAFIVPRRAAPPSYLKKRLPT